MFFVSFLFFCVGLGAPAVYIMHTLFRVVWPAIFNEFLLLIKKKKKKITSSTLKKKIENNI